MDLNNLWSEYDLNTKKAEQPLPCGEHNPEWQISGDPVLGQGGFGITYVGYYLNGDECRYL